MNGTQRSGGFVWLRRRGKKRRTEEKERDVLYERPVFKQEKRNICKNVRKKGREMFSSKEESNQTNEKISPKRLDKQDGIYVYAHESAEDVFGLRAA
ncbi:MAG: hypothetical protein NVS2B12_20890 [Ktedonobacteraceae bacterium]